MFAAILAGTALGTAGDDFVIAEWTAEVGTHPIAPFHVHHADDEAWYVLDGALGFQLGGERVRVEPGGAVLARRGVPHTFWNAGATEARYLIVMTPNLASLIEAVHAPDADIAKIFADHASELVPAPSALSDLD